MAGGYTYDEQGNYKFFVLTILVLVLLPWTYNTLKSDHRVNESTKPCEGWNVKDQDVKRAKSSTANFKKRHIFLALGWAYLAVVGYQAAQIKFSGVLYDPFEILGIKTGSSEKDIKRHYKRLSIKYHPDKMKLTGNMTKEDVDSKYIELTKAYKSLTDETIRRNFELYGHPDGKQEYAMGIAIPKSVVDSKNNVYVLGVYALIFGLLLPYGVSRWWYGTQKVTKDRILNETAALFFLYAKEETNFAQAISIIAAAQEMKDMVSTKKAKAVVSSQAFASLEEKVKEQLRIVCGEKLEGALYERSHCRKAAVLIYAHLLRVTINDVAVLRVKQQVVSKAHHLCTGLGNIILAHSWLKPYLATSTLQEALVQALHPSLPSVNQLPYLPLVTRSSTGIETMDEFVNSPEGIKGKIMEDMSPAERKQAEAVARRWPKLELVDAAFQVIGERIITVGAIVQLVVQVKVTPPKAHKGQTNGIPSHEEEDDISKPAQVVKAAEQSTNELIGRKVKGADGEVENYWAHAPRFPNNRKPGWNVFVADHKLDRIYVTPGHFSEIGESSVRTLRLQVQAPPNPGLYTFQMYVKSDCYLSTDIRKDMKMDVKGQDALTAAENPEEDEISEPDEDTLAGQMALMQGKAVRRIADASEDEDDSDDTSGTEESASEVGTTSESDSD